MTCLIDECERDARTRGLCKMHYERWRRGRLNVKPLPYKEPRKCSVEGCDRAYHSHNYCELHARRWRKTGDPQADKPPLFDRPRKTCSVDGCWRQARARGLCKTHWDRLTRQGDVMAHIPISGSGQPHPDDCAICEEAKWAAANHVPSSRIADAYRMSANGLQQHLRRNLPELLDWYYGTRERAS